MSEVVIQTVHDGPFLVKGPIQLLDAEGKAIVTKAEPIGLCRCGHSTNKPFCDGCHRQGRFQLLPLL
jgi:CDGSH-type Zn-finger protein